MATKARRRQEEGGITVLAFPMDGIEGTVKVSMRDPGGSSEEDTIDLLLTTTQARLLSAMLNEAEICNSHGERRPTGETP